MHGPFETLLIANRGEIAVRIIRAAQSLGLRTIAVYGAVDRRALHVALADEAYYIGDEASSLPYLQISRIIKVAAQSGAQAIHPGYGFLAERADFARAVIDAGLVWVGPPPLAMTAMAEKDTAKARAQDVGVAVVPGVETRDLSWPALRVAAAELGYPLLIKAVCGGGGRGMRVVRAAEDLQEALGLARHEAANAFGDDTLLLERFVERGRHIEVQVLCDHHGGAVHLFERECSVQRRHQKLIEESPAPGLTPEFCQALCADAVRLVQSIDYVGAGTVEFLVDVDSGERYFLEVNARIQVEHPVTEMRTGVDLVQAQLRVAAGEPLWLSQADIDAAVAARGLHVIEARLCAEDARDDHRPQAGEVLAWRPPNGGLDLALRVDTALRGETALRGDTGLEVNDTVSIYYDSMVAKIITSGPTRLIALRRLRRALDQTELTGLASNRAFLAAVLDHDRFRAGQATTAFLSDYAIAAPADPITDGWFVAAALVRHATRLTRRFRSNPWRADVTLFTQKSGDIAHVYLQHRSDDRWLFAVDHHPDADLAMPVAPSGHARLLARGDGWLRLEVEGKITDYRLRSIADTVWIQRPGHDSEALTEGTLLPEPEAEALPAGAVVSPSAAMVTAVHVAVGDHVAEGDALVTVEAMKMLTVLRAGEAGAVHDVLCAHGDAVKSGQILVDIRAKTPKIRSER